MLLLRCSQVETRRCAVVEGSSAEYVAGVDERHAIALGRGPLTGGPSSRAFLTARPVPIGVILAKPSFEPWA